MDNKKRYTVSSPPRVHEIARATGMTSQQTRSYLYAMEGISYKTPSHRVPLSIAIRFLDWIRKQ